MKLNEEKMAKIAGVPTKSLLKEAENPNWREEYQAIEDQIEAINQKVIKVIEAYMKSSDFKKKVGLTKVALHKNYGDVIELVWKEKNGKSECTAVLYTEIAWDKMACN